MIKTVLLTLLATAMLGISAAAAFVYAGGYDVAATDPHWPVTYWIMEQTRINSIKARAAGIIPPLGFDAPTNVASAAGHFAAHCAMCHGAPGIDRGDFAAGMYPQPPSLTDISKRYTPTQLFWIVKHGLKMSGMPSMADDGDDLLWATVGLLEKLPGMTPGAFKELVEASNMQGMNMGGDPTPPADAHDDHSAGPGPH